MARFATTSPLRLDMLNREVATGGVLNTAQLILFKNQTLFTKNVVVADLEPATFNGYDPQDALTWGTAFVASDGTAKIPATSIQFTKQAGVDTNLIWGWALLNAAGTKVLAGESFDEPVPMVNEGDGLVITPIIPYGE